MAHSRSRGQPASLGQFAGRDPVERMLLLVECVPPGRVITYGDLAEMAEYGGPRTAGLVLGRYGAAVPWHRVVRADGALPPAHAAQALERLMAEGCPVWGDRRRVDMERARWRPGPEELSEALATLAHMQAPPTPKQPRRSDAS